jgi:hypothetical protein
LASPNTQVFEAENLELLRRKEQQLFDRRAREAGFAFLAFPSGRWFSRQPVNVAAPRRGVHAHELRSERPFDEASRPDLTRDTKQALAYAELASTLAARNGTSGSDAAKNLGEAMRSAVNALAGLAGYRYLGLDPLSFEPLFQGAGGPPRLFDSLPTQCRHLVALGALTLRALWVADAGNDLKANEAVVAVDQIELHQDATSQTKLIPLLRRALPRVQWVVATSSDLVAGSVGAAEVVALRRMVEEEVVLFTGADARTH